MSQNLVVTLSRPVCLPGISEDSLRELIDAIRIGVADGDDEAQVTSTGGVEVVFQFGPDGNFAGAFAQLAGETIPLIPGTYSNALQIFKGAPSGSNPGPGWKLEVELTQKYLAQSGSEGSWEIFFASRVPVVSTTT